MARTRFTAKLVIDPATGQPPEEVRGQTALIAAEGTDTPLALTYDRAGNLPMPNPVQITPLITTPQFYTDEGVLSVDVVSGGHRIGIDSFDGAMELTAAAAADARTARFAAQDSAAAAEAAKEAAERAAQVSGGYTVEQLQDLVAGMLVTEAGVPLEYDDAAGRVTVPTSGAGGGGGGAGTHLDVEWRGGAWMVFHGGALVPLPEQPLPGYRYRDFKGPQPYIGPQWSGVEDSYEYWVFE